MTSISSWVEQLDRMAADEIAALFKTEGVTGFPGVVERCPIANFLRDIGNAEYVYVGGTIVYWEATGARSRRAKARGGIIEFVTRFDAGFYPELFPSPAVAENPERELCPV